MIFNFENFLNGCSKVMQKSNVLGICQWKWKEKLAGHWNSSKLCLHVRTSATSDLTSPGRTAHCFLWAVELRLPLCPRGDVTEVACSIFFAAVRTHNNWIAACRHVWPQSEATVGSAAASYSWRAPWWSWVWAESHWATVSSGDAHMTTDYPLYPLSHLSWIFVGLQTDEILSV